MNIEFILLILDYFRTIKRRDFLLEWLLPILIGSFCFYLNYGTKETKDIADALKNISSNGVSLLGVLIGFSIAVLTLLITASSQNLTEIKSMDTGIVKAGFSVTLYELLLINYSYSVVAEVLVLIMNLLIPSLAVKISPFKQKALIGIDIFLLCHVLLLTLRNITNFYFVLTRKDK